MPRASDSSQSPREALRVARLLAEVLDQRLSVPGIRLPVGLDPLIGLIPGVGDLVANALGAVILLIAHRCQVPRIVLVRMALNTMINGAIGAIPILGDLFSFWFKSNVRNVALLEKHAGTGSASTVGDWAFVIGLVLAVLALLIGILIGAVWVVKMVWTSL